MKISKTLTKPNKSSYSLLDEAFESFDRNGQPQFPTSHAQTIQSTTKREVESYLCLCGQRQHLTSFEVYCEYAKQCHETTKQVFKNTRLNLFKTNAVEKEKKMRMVTCQHIETILTTMNVKRTLEKVLYYSKDYWMQSTSFKDGNIFCTQTVTRSKQDITNFMKFYINKDVNKRRIPAKAEVLNLRKLADRWPRPPLQTSHVSEDDHRKSCRS